MRAKPRAKPEAPKPGKIVAAAMTAVSTLDPSRKTMAKEIEEAMVDAILQATSRGWDDKAILEAKMQARQRVLDRWAAAAPDPPPD